MASTVQDKVIAIIAEQALLEVGDVQLGATLEDLGIDSMGLVESIFAIEEAFDISGSEADAISQCTEKEILEAIQKLSTAYRTVFNMYVIEGYSHKEIAVELGITESTSRSNLVKARMKLKTILSSRFYGYEE